MNAIEDTIERVAHDSYGRLLACLTARSRDLTASEDALAEAFQAALNTWPKKGIPDNPEAWLHVVARRRLADDQRRIRNHTEFDAALMDERSRDIESDDFGIPDFGIPDERLQLLFLCAHPAIDSSMHTPLMLQSVFGLKAERIASAFVVRPSTMGQRLSRVKTKIKEAKIRFALPERNEMADRLKAVLEAIYAAYGTAWDDPAGSVSRLRGLADEALFLGRLITSLLPDQPETHGMLALMLYCESRRGARRTSSGEYVPLGEQPVALWSKELLVEAEQHLATAARAGTIGRFQLEAAIQSAHASRLATGFTDWAAITALYEALLRIAPTVGIRVSHAAAVGETHGPAAALRLLACLPSEQIASYQPYWAVVAHLHSRLRCSSEAAYALERAIGLCDDAAVRRFLTARLNALRAV